MSSRKILFVDGLRDAFKKQLESVPGNLEIEVREKISRANLLKKMNGVEILCVRTQTHVDEEVLKSSKELRLVVRQGTGVDHIDLKAAARLKISVMNTASANSVSAAELTVGLLLSLSRSIPSAASSLNSGHWKRPTIGFELDRKRVGIIGLGRVGRLVSRRLQSFGMRVSANDPYRNQDYGDQMGVRLVPLNELLANSDIVSLHIPLNGETMHLINDQRLKAMKTGSVLINTSRGGVIDEEAIFKNLASGRLSAYAADVFDAEPLPENHPFVNHPRILMTPHIGAHTIEAQDRVDQFTIRQIQTYLVTGEIEHQVFG